MDLLGRGLVDLRKEVTVKKRCFLFILMAIVALGPTACSMGDFWRWFDEMFYHGSFEEETMEAEEAPGEEYSGDEPHCFPADTLVLMERSTKRISDVHVGDRIMTLGENGEVRLSTVTHTRQFECHHYYLLNGKIRVTGLHRFLTSEGWKRARDLRRGDGIKTSRKGFFEEITSKERISADVKVYDLGVAENENFIISHDGKSTYVVHNNGNGNGK